MNELNDHEYYKVQKKIEEEFSSSNNVKFVKCSRMAKYIENGEELKEQIALFHKNEYGR